MQSTDCPFCKHANPAGAKFCNECGSPLHLVPCGHCDAVNHVNDLQCYRCGASRVPRTIAAQGGDPVDEQPIGLDQQARWVERELLRFDEEPSQPTLTSPPGDAENGANESGLDAIEHNLGALNPALPEVEPDGRETVGAEAGSLAGASALAADGRSGPKLWPSGGSRLPETRRLFGEIGDRPRSRWPEILGGVSAALVVLALIAGGYWYYDKNLVSRVVQNEVSERAPTERAPTYSDRRLDQAPAPLRPERTALAPQSKAVDFEANSPPLPAEALLAAPGAKAPAKPTPGQEDTTVVSRPDPVAEAATVPRCPPAVAAMSLCDWVARADRN
jgi:Double zinc ribbon